MIQKLIIICFLFIALFGFHFFFKNKLKNEVYKIYNNLNNPVCIIDSKNRIVWKNESFSKKFHKIKNDDNFKENFAPKNLMNKSIATYENEELLIYHKKYQDKFVISFEKFQELGSLNEIPYPIALIDKNNKIIEANYAFEDMIGAKIYKEQIEKFAKKFELDIQKMENGKEIIWQTLTGIAPIITWVKPYKDNYLIFLENRIEFIKVKNKAQEAQHLQILGQLASSITHDFNNLLTSISGFTEMLEEKLPYDDSLKQIKRNVEQASQLTKELLNFVKEKPVEQKTSEPKILIPIIAVMLKKLLGSKVDFKYNCATNGIVPISDTQLEQIILNMALNSKDAMQDGGSFSIKTNSEYFYSDKVIMKNKSLKKGNYFVIEFKDTGSGISQENIQKIFSPFFSTKTKGTGLGLASCIRIAEHANGGINFTTSESGTTFFVYLPILEKQSIEKKQGIIKSTLEFDENTSKKVILVEDEELIRNLMKKSLEQEGYIIAPFSNGADALNAIKNENFDILISDAVLPGIDGTQLAHAAYSKSNKSKILIVSGYSLEDLGSKLPANVNYLAKPFALKDLKEKLKKMNI